MKATAFWIHHLLRFDTFDAEAVDSSAPVNLGASLRSMRQRISHWMFSGNEPKVWKKANRSGHMIWYGYDPVANIHVEFDNEAGIRRWLEKRYNEPVKGHKLVVLR